MGAVVPEVTSRMVEAGSERLKDLSGDSDTAYVVEAVYLAMEYERLDSQRELPRLVSQAPQE
jgi:hypothetical protein